jgi:hypothetical protein
MTQIDADEEWASPTGARFESPGRSEAEPWMGYQHPGKPQRGEIPIAALFAFGAEKFTQKTKLLFVSYGGKKGLV